MADKDNTLRVVSVQVKDVLGAQELAIEPGQITVVSGTNGSGKSTALKAVQAALQGGNLCHLARVDPATKAKAEEPEIVLVLRGDGNEEHRVTKKGNKVEVKSRIGDTAAFGKVPQPQSFLSGLFDGAAANPVKFLTAPDKERALLLLEALPLKFDRAALLAEMGVEEKDLPPVPKGLPNALEEVELIRDAVYRTRTGVNVNLRTKREGADEVRKAAPAVIPGDPSKAIEQLEQEIAAADRDIEREEAEADATEAAAVKDATHQHDTEEQGIRGEFSAWKAQREAAHAGEAAEIRAKAETLITKLHAEMETEIDGRRTAGEQELAGLDSMLEASREAIRETREAARGATAGRRAGLQAERDRLAGLRSQRDESRRAATLHAQAKKFDDEAESLRVQADHLTRALEKLDAYRRRMAEDLPIAGLEIRGEEITVHGIPFDQLNAAQRTAVAVEVATLRAQGSRLPLIFVDDAEKLDRVHFDALVAELKKRGVQAFLARVTNEPFQVTTEPPDGGMASHSDVEIHAGGGR